MHQGWPKFAAHLWMASPDGGLAAAAWAPCRVETTIRSVPIRVDVETDYPFRDRVDVIVQSGAQVRFPLHLRVPAWADGALRVGSGPDTPMRPGSMHLVDRTWGKEPTRLALRFPMRPKVTTRYNGAVAVERGPLVYSLLIGEQWAQVNADKPHRELPHGDFEVHATTPWNYGLAVDPRRPDAGIAFEERPVGDRPFSPEGAGTMAHARGRRIPAGKWRTGGPARISPADVAWSDPGKATTDQPLEDVTLIPYGCTNIRITEFPAVSLQSTAAIASISTR